MGRALGADEGAARAAGGGTSRPISTITSTDETVRRRNEWPSAVHPVVRTHPETGRKALFVNSIFTRRILGVTESESRALLAFLFEHVADPHFQCRFRWRSELHRLLGQPDCVQHHAMWDYYPETRSGTRRHGGGRRPYH